MVMEKKIRFSNYFIKRMLSLAIVTGLIISITMPLTYLVMAIIEKKDQANIHSQQLAAKLAESVKENPRLWSYNSPKVAQLFSAYQRDSISSITILNNKHKIVHTEIITEPTLLKLSGSSPIKYNNLIFGYVEVAEKTGTIFRFTGMLLFIFSTLGFTIALMLFRFPTKIVLQAENENLQVFRKLNYITYALGEGVFVTNEEGCLSFINPAAERLLGWSKEELLGKDVLEVLFGDSLQVLRKDLTVNETIKLGESFSIDDEIFLRKDGTKLPVSFVTNPICENGRIIGSITVFHDITERKQTEEEVARLERLHLVGEMAAGIGHEIRNPMTTVRGFLQIFTEKSEFIKYKEHFELMIEELDRANSIIKEYLNLAKDKTINLTLHNLNSIISAISPLIQADAILSDKHVNLQLGDIPNLQLDEQEMRQLILNLTRNGLEAMSSGGRLTVSTYQEGEEVVLSVADQGKGIDPDLLEKLGTPFLSSKEEGTGLGLAICFSIVARHNALLKVNTDDRGTTFFVHFRLQKTNTI